MYCTNVSALPFQGMSRQFVGEDQANVQMSAFLAKVPPGRATAVHTHPYDTVAFVQAGTGTWTVDGESRQMSVGDIVVVKAGSVHRFENTGSVPLAVLDIHLWPHFEQVNL